MKTKFSFGLGPEDRVHVSFTTRKKRVIKFSINYTALINKKWIPIIRYDTAHDLWRSPHKHLFYLKKKPTILVYPNKDYNALYTRYYQELKRDYKKIKDNYLTN